MKQAELKREDLARTLAERSPLSNSQAQDELDRLVHGIVTSLRQGLATEMPGVGLLTSKASAKKTAAQKESPAKAHARKPKS
jgi:nucleoid DNA-binding protein